MFYIREEQNKALSDNLMKSFAARTLLFLRENASTWCKDKDDEKLGMFIDSMIEFAQNHFIFNENNIQQLMLYKIEYNFAIPLTDYKQMRLGRENFGEDYRMSQFYLALLAQNDLIRITLDSDIETLRERENA